MKIVQAVAVSACAIAVLMSARGTPAQTQPLRPCPRSDAAAAAQCLRRLYFDQDYDDGHAQGATLVARFPASPELRAWLAANLASDMREDSAMVVVARMRERWPGSAWTHFARALTLARWGGSWEEARSAAARARRLAPGQRDMWWLNAYLLWLDDKPAAAAALIDTAATRVGASPELLVQQVWALRQAAGQRGGDSAQVARGEAILQRALAMDSSNGSTWSLWGAYRYTARDMENARRGALRAAAAAPRSLRFQLDLMSIAFAGGGLRTPEQKRDSSRAWWERIEATRGESPAALKAAIWAFRDLGADSIKGVLEERLLARYPGSIEAEWVLTERPRMLMGQVYRRAVPDTLQAMAEARRQLRAFIARPVHHSTALAGDAYLQLFHMVQHDSTISDAEMARIVGGMERYVRGRVSDRNVAGALALADRGLELPRAERLASAAPRLLAGETHSLRRMYDSEGEFVDAMAKERASAYDALAWVYFKEGKPSAAARLEAQAQATRRDLPLALYHSARMAEAAGQHGRALDLYARGYVAERQDSYRPNEAALLRLYRAQHKSEEGYAGFVASLQEQERAHRRAKVLAARRAQPRALPAFALQRLGGGSVSSDSLRGKVVVIDFWGMWCGPCVRELPQVQAVFERYRADPDVLVLTIDNDRGTEDLGTFLARRKLNLPVLLDDGYVDKVNVHAFPTMWFLDRQGRIAFEQVGESDSVAEEAGWRVEALKVEGRGVTLR